MGVFASSLPLNSRPRDGTRKKWDCCFELGGWRYPECSDSRLSKFFPTKPLLSTSSVFARSHYVVYFVQPEKQRRHWFSPTHFANGRRQPTCTRWLVWKCGTPWRAYNKIPDTVSQSYCRNTRNLGSSIGNPLFASQAIDDTRYVESRFFFHMVVRRLFFQFFFLYYYIKKEDVSVLRSRTSNDNNVVIVIPQDNRSVMRTSQLVLLVTQCFILLNKAVGRLDNRIAFPHCFSF